MKTIREHIEYVKGQPHHVRRRIAFGIAGVGAGLIAFVWLSSSLYTGAFAVQGSSFADATGQSGIEATGGANNNGGNSQNLAGAAAALPAVNVPAHIEIIDAASSTKAAKKAEETTIPF